MSFTKSALLGTAAIFATVAGAQAADLPSKKAAPVNFVKICDTYGAGFFTVPGTETCVKLGGRVRYDFAYSPTGDYYSKDGVKDTSVQDTYGQHVRARISVDARTPTDYGTVRTMFTMRMSQDTGFLTGVQSPYKDSNTKDYLAVKTTGNAIENAFVQFMGFTAGRAPELLVGDWMSLSIGSNSRFPSFATGVLGLSYTAVLGGGLSASVGIEDNSHFDGQNVTVTGFKAPFQTPYDALPLIVGKLSWDQAWGQIQVGGAIAQNRSVNQTSETVNVYDKTKSGYAFGGQIKLNADMIAKGDAFYLLGGYSSGINKLGYKFANKDSEARDVDGIGQSYTNFTCNATATDCQNTTSKYVSVGFTHYWTPTIRQNLMAGMAWVDPGSLATAAAATTQKADFSHLGTNLIWSPTRGFDLGVEVLYNRASVKSTAGLGCLKQGATAGCDASGDNFITRLRVERTF